MATGAAFGLVWDLVRGNEAGWSSPTIVVIGGILLTAGFVAWERRARQPMLPMQLFGSRSFSAGIAAAFLLSGSLYAAVFFIAQFFQAGLGHDPLAAGVRLLPWTGTLLLVALWRARWPTGSACVPS